METDLELGKVVSELTAIRSDMFDAENRYLPDWQAIPDAHRCSARNLLHYLALRKRDRRLLQDQLAALGLSSLGRAESQALGNVQAVLDLIQLLGGATANGALLPHGFSDGRMPARREHVGATGADAGRTSCAHHGDDARRGSRRFRSGPRSVAVRHELHVHQHGARRRARVGSDARQSGACDARHGEVLPGPDGPRWSQAAHRCH